MNAVQGGAPKRQSAACRHRVLCLGRQHQRCRRTSRCSHAVLLLCAGCAVCRVRLCGVIVYLLVSTPPKVTFLYIYLVGATEANVNTGEKTVTATPDRLRVKAFTPLLPGFYHPWKKKQKKQIRNVKSPKGEKERDKKKRRKRRKSMTLRRIISYRL